MDRLSFINSLPMTIVVVLSGLLLLQCRPERDGASETPSRVVAVQQRPSTEDPLPAFCDFLDAKGGSKTPTLPAMDNAPLLNSNAKIKWVVLWATWCRPCIEEMPHIVEWVNRLKQSGTSLEVIFVSVDEDKQALQRFYQKRPDYPPSAHLRDSAALPELITGAGLDAGAGLPIHLFIDSSNAVRCARAAAVGAADYPALERISQLK